MLLKGASFSLLRRENMNALEVEAYTLLLADSEREETEHNLIKLINNHEIFALDL